MNNLIMIQYVILLFVFGINNINNDMIFIEIK